MSFVSHRFRVSAALCASMALACGEDTPDAEPAAAPLAAADVTFLVPLASVTDFGAATGAGHGVLFPREHFDSLERLTVTDEPDDLYAALSVVGVRLDPCFIEGLGQTPCASQVRLVLQPVLELDGATSTRDATVHLFYAVPEADVRALARSMQTLRLSAGGSEAIGPHAAPKAAAQLVLPHIGAERLSRVTFVAVHASDQAWTFGGFDIADGVATPIDIVGGDHTDQHLTSTGGTETLDATILPAPTVEPDLPNYLAALSRETLTEADRTLSLAAVDRILDPAEHDTGTLDCASCHMATAAARHEAARLGMEAGYGAAYANSQNQRMLGYFGTEPSVSPRVEAETLAVLSKLAEP